MYSYIKTIMFITREVYFLWWKAHSKIQQIRLRKCINYSSIVMCKIKWQAYERMEVILIYACPVPKFLDSLRIMALIRQRHFVWSGFRGGGWKELEGEKRTSPCSLSPTTSSVVPLDAFVTPSLILLAIGVTFVAARGLFVSKYSPIFNFPTIRFEVNFVVNTRRPISLPSSIYRFVPL